VSTGGIKTSEVGRLWFRLLQPFNAVRGVSVRDGLRKRTGRAGELRKSPAATRCATIELAEAGASE